MSLLPQLYQGAMGRVQMESREGPILIRLTPPLPADREVVEGWFCRLADDEERAWTPWEGPFANEWNARAHLYEELGKCPRDGCPGNIHPTLPWCLSCARRFDLENRRDYRGTRASFVCGGTWFGLSGWTNGEVRAVDVGPLGEEPGVLFVAEVAIAVYPSLDLGTLLLEDSVRRALSARGVSDEIARRALPHAARAEIAAGLMMEGFEVLSETVVQLEPEATRTPSDRAEMAVSAMGLRLLVDSLLWREYSREIMPLRITSPLIVDRKEAW